MNRNECQFYKTIKVGIYDNEPKVFDLIVRISKSEGWKLEFIINDWNNCLEMLKVGKIDIMPDVAFSEERNEVYGFNKIPVLISYSTFYSNKKIRLEKLSDINNKKIAILKSSIQGKNLIFLKQSLLYSFELIEAPSIKDAFNLTRQGICDCAISNNFFGNYFYKKYDLKKTTIELFPVELFFASKKNENIDILNTIDKYLLAWKQKENSYYYAVLRRWKISEKERIDNIIKIIIFLITFITIVLVLYSKILKTRMKTLKNRINLAIESIKISEKTFQEFSTISLIGVFKLDKNGKVTLKYSGHMES